jgi:hypothetical protein
MTCPPVYFSLAGWLAGWLIPTGPTLQTGDTGYSNERTSQGYTWDPSRLHNGDISPSETAVAGYQAESINIFTSLTEKASLVGLADERL